MVEGRSLQPLQLDSSKCGFGHFYYAFRNLHHSLHIRNQFPGIGFRFPVYPLNVDYNKTYEDEVEKRGEIIRQIVGTIGDGFFFHGPCISVPRWNSLRF